MKPPAASSHPLALLGLGAGCLLAACGGAEGAGRDLDAVPALALEEVYRVGSVDDPDAGFVDPGPMDMDADGNLYVFERQDMEVRVLDPRGRFVGRFGRRGQGPGEFARAGRLGVAGDTLWSIESAGMGSARVSLFTLAGEHLDTRSVGSSVRVEVGRGMQGIVQPWIWRRDGTVEGDITIFIRERDADPTAGPEPGTMVRVPRVRFHLDGERIDTVGFYLRRALGSPPERSTVQVQGRSFNVPSPPSDDARGFLVADGRVDVQSPTPTGPDDAVLTYARTGLQGDTLRHRSFGYTPEGYTEAFLDSTAMRTAAQGNGMVMIVDGQIQQEEPLEDPALAARTIRDAIDFPPYAPAVADVVGGQDGSAWIQWTDDGELRDRWLLLDAEGEPVGRFQLPRNAIIRWASGRELVTVERDDFDIPWVVRYRLVEGG